MQLADKEEIDIRTTLIYDALMTVMQMEGMLSPEMKRSSRWYCRN
jgi:hypothetical protein